MGLCGLVVFNSPGDLDKKYGVSQKLAAGECERLADDQGTRGPQYSAFLAQRARTGGFSRVSRKPSPSCPFPLPPPFRPVRVVLISRPSHCAMWRTSLRPAALPLPVTQPKENVGNTLSSSRLPAGRGRANELTTADTRQTCPVDSLGRLLDPGRQHLGGEGGGQEGARRGAGGSGVLEVGQGRQEWRGVCGKQTRSWGSMHHYGWVPLGIEHLDGGGGHGRKS